MQSFDSEDKLIYQLIEGYKNSPTSHWILTVLQQRLVNYLNALLGFKEFYRVMKICEYAEDAMVSDVVIFNAHALAYQSLVEECMNTNQYISAIAACDTVIQYVDKITKLNDKFIYPLGVIFSQRACAYASLGRYAEADEDTLKAINLEPHYAEVFARKKINAKLEFERSLTDFIQNEPTSNYMKADADGNKALNRKAQYLFYVETIQSLIIEAEEDSLDRISFMFHLAELYAKCLFTYAYCHTTSCMKNNSFCLLSELNELDNDDHTLNKYGNLFSGNNIEIQQERIKLAAQCYIDTLEMTLNQLKAIRGKPVSDLTDEQCDLLAVQPHENDKEETLPDTLHAHDEYNFESAKNIALKKVLLSIGTRAAVRISQLCLSSAIAKKTLTENLGVEYKKKLIRVLIETQSLDTSDAAAEDIQMMKAHLRQNPTTNIFVIFGVPRILLAHVSKEKDKRKP